MFTAVRSSPRLLERDILPGGGKGSFGRGAARSARERPQGITRLAGPQRRGCSISLVGPKILSSRRYIEQSRPDEHGALTGSPATISGSPHRGICGKFALKIENAGIKPENHSQGIDEEPAPRVDLAAQKNRL